MNDRMINSPGTIITGPGMESPADDDWQPDRIFGPVITIRSMITIDRPASYMEQSGVRVDTLGPAVVSPPNWIGECGKLQSSASTPEEALSIIVNALERAMLTGGLVYFNRVGKTNEVESVMSDNLSYGSDSNKSTVVITAKEG